MIFATEMLKELTLLQASPRVIIEGLAMSLLAAYALYAPALEDNSNALPILGCCWSSEIVTLDAAGLLWLRQLRDQVNF